MSEFLKGFIGIVNYEIIGGLVGVFSLVALSFLLFVVVAFIIYKIKGD